MRHMVMHSTVGTLCCILLNLKVRIAVFKTSPIAQIGENCAEIFSEKLHSGTQTFVYISRDFSMFPVESQASDKLANNLKFSHLFPKLFCNLSEVESLSNAKNLLFNKSRLFSPTVSGNSGPNLWMPCKNLDQTAARVLPSLQESKFIIFCNSLTYFELPHAPTLNQTAVRVVVLKTFKFSALKKEMLKDFQTRFRAVWSPVENQHTLEKM